MLYVFRDLVLLFNFSITIIIQELVPNTTLGPMYWVSSREALESKVP